MHSGVSLNSGHYTAFINYNQTINDNIFGNFNNKYQLFQLFCSSFIDNSKSNSCDSCTCSVLTNNNDSTSPEWLHFDDTRVKLLTNNEFHRKIVDSNIDSPYILFYNKV
jgi:hypothetical protein